MNPVAIPDTPYLIVEGSYCFHPDAGRPYDVCVFLSIPYEEQIKRISQRDGDWLLQRFIREWIPLTINVYCSVSPTSADPAPLAGVHCAFC